MKFVPANNTEKGRSIQVGPILSRKMYQQARQAVFIIQY